MINNDNTFILKIIWYNQQKMFCYILSFFFWINRFLSSKPHLAGTPRDEELAQYIKSTWLEQGLDDAYLVPYTILLSYSNPDNPNLVQIIDSVTKNAIFTSHFKEDSLELEPNNPEVRRQIDIDMVNAYHGYAPKADVSGLPVYCNYGTKEDFYQLSRFSIDVRDKICIVRYGKIYRGNKVSNAADNMCAGVVIFSDPLDVAKEGTDPKDVYPNTWWMPGSSIQRGNVRSRNGDPLTPGYPALGLNIKSMS